MASLAHYKRNYFKGVTNNNAIDAKKKEKDYSVFTRNLGSSASRHT
jgi:hypothetical protein